MKAVNHYTNQELAGALRAHAEISCVPPYLRCILNESASRLSGDNMTVEDRVRALASVSKIQAIKQYRNETSASLKDAKEYVESLL